MRKRVHFAARVKELRVNKLGLTQEEFSRTYPVPLGTLRNWEQGLREPEGWGMVLFILIEHEPALMASLVRMHGIQYKARK